MLHSLSHQGIDRETYLRLSGNTEEETIEQAKPDADQALRREAVLAAVAEAESLEPSEEEMLDAVRDAAPGEKTKPEKLLERLRNNGRLDSLKDDLAQRKAWDLVVESAKPVPPRQIPDHRTFTILVERPGVGRGGPLLVFARVVPARADGQLKDSSVRSETKRGP